MKPILEIRNISKQYTIGGQKKRYLSLRESFIDKMKAVAKPKQKTFFWALKDINFDVYPGDTIGIIGKNGAGKSTLLKILSRITPPTKGFIKARGRVASLLEVGTGFHPELTGRENIFLNGSILGLKKSEIQGRFDEIVDFSGVEQFLDTPLKHFSSGMQLRLAFSVAAHLEPEILVVDEVLAVGDAEFQKKCLGKMQEVSKNEGRTVLFVSHNMGAVQTLCSKGLVIEKGEIICNDKVEDAIEKYLNLGLRDKTSSVQLCQDLNKNLNITAISLLNSNDEPASEFKFGESFSVKINVLLHHPFKKIYPTIGLDTVEGVRIFTARGMDIEHFYKGGKGETLEIKASFNNFLVPGMYRIMIRMLEGHGLVLDYKPDVLSFEVVNIPFDKTVPFSGGFGIIRIHPQWS